MSETVVYLAIYKTKTETITVEYVPLDGGLIEIVSASIVRKPVTQFQEREADRRKRVYQSKRRPMDLTR